MQASMYISMYTLLMCYSIRKRAVYIIDRTHSRHLYKLADDIGSSINGKGHTIQTMKHYTIELLNWNIKGKQTT